jgi:uncharacterized protein VirK/YbjX
MGTIVRSARADRRTFGTGVAALRALRSARALRHRDQTAELLANAAYRAHVAAVAPADPLCFLSHKAYLARGLDAAQRTACAVDHYRHQVDAFVPAFHNAVYGGTGLTLWSAVADGTRYDIRLVPGNDVLYEGGLSVVFFVEGQRMAVVSYSRVDGSTIGHDAGPLLFVTRKQLTADHGYQAAFNAAFDRTTPAHLCFAALTGIALALGHRAVAAIRPEVHPGFEDRYAARFDTAYTQFWTSLAGQRRGDVAFAVPVPMEMTPLEELSAKARKRATLRRRHLEDVCRRAMTVIGDHLVDGVAARPVDATDQADDPVRVLDRTT